uniref:Reverse transcriptase domain-containing protein n=1 Tax=Plectus sambesii TaxID=2011161 RepID=A0A914VN53_9BILA
MKPGKTPGNDRVTIEMLQLGREKLLPYLTRIFNICLDQKMVPESMSNLSTILIHKKGDPLQLQNYRPISLLSVIYKLLTKVINNRVEGVLDNAQTPEQASFRQHYSNIDQIYTINELVKRCHEYHIPLFMQFINFKKAFDFIEFNAVWTALQEQGVHADLIELLCNIYATANSAIRINEDRVQIDINRGVRQGDTISPKLFTACLEHVMQRLPWSKQGIKINGRRLSNLRFAEDIVLFAERPEELQRMATELKNAAREVGLEINVEKTKSMGTAPMLHPIRLGNDEVEQVNKFIYLGHLLNIPRDHAKEAVRRKQAGWHAFNKHGDFLRAQNIEMKFKRRLFNQCILPAMLYGAECWAVTQHAEEILATTQRRMERLMVGATLLDRKSNEWLRGVTKVKDVVEEARKRKARWAWNIARMDNYRWAKIITE